LSELNKNNMPWNSEHTKWFKTIKGKLTTSDGKNVILLEFNPDFNDTVTISKWAMHFRNHYCFDTEIDILRKGTGFTRKQYLLNIKFPTTTRNFGPVIRSGDFSEILIADYIEFILSYWVPRTRYGNKVIRDESTKGSDLIGFKIYDENQTVNDILSMIEVKAQFSGNKANPRLQDAINDSIKDDLRKAESLNAMKQRLFDKGHHQDVNKIARFQNPVDIPYTTKYGAAALFSNSIFEEKEIKKTIASGHPHNSDLFLIVLKGNNLMNVVNKLFKIASDES
jgi:transcriptional regulator